MHIGVILSFLCASITFASDFAVKQEAEVHVFQTDSYVNDHTFIQAPDGSWHLFGIFHKEPCCDGSEETDFVHAVTQEKNPANWKEGSFKLAPAELGIALKSDPSLGETHLWAPHVVQADGRYLMFYQSGGQDNDRAGIRLAISDDLYHWVKAGQLFEDVCVARDPMLKQVGHLWALYYTRCDSKTDRHSGVAVRVSYDLVHWSSPQMALTLHQLPQAFNSPYTESPFVFQVGNHYFLSVTSYPIDWAATFLFESDSPFSFTKPAIARLNAHAGEWIQSGNTLLLSHAGAGQHGVWISRVSIRAD